MRRAGIIVLTIISIILISLSFGGCTKIYTADDIKKGKYTFNNSVIYIKEDSKISFENVDFSEVQAYYNENNININLSERTVGDVYFEVSDDDPSCMYVLTDEVMVLNMSYDFKNVRIEFLGNTYVFS